MKGVIVIALATVLIGCSNNASKPLTANPPAKTGGTTVQSLQESAVPGMEGLTLASSISNGNVTIYPVTSKKASQKDLDDMVTLDEAKRKGWVEIVEQPDETVEQLEVINKGPKAIFLLAGEVLLGGKQDRIVAKDTIVKPGETVKVPVYCVDQHRWEGGDDFAPSAKFAPSEVRKAAAVEQDQGLVWDKVAVTNESMGKIDGASKAKGGDSLKKTLDSKVLQTRQKDADSVVAEIMKIKDVVGIVTVVNGKVQGFEYFGSNTFFGKALPAIMRGVFTDSLIASKEMGKADAKEAAKFVADSLQGKRSQISHAGLYNSSALESTTSSGVVLSGSRNGDADGLYRGSFYSKEKK